MSVSLQPAAGGLPNQQLIQFDQVPYHAPRSFMVGLPFYPEMYCNDWTEDAQDSSWWIPMALRTLVGWQGLLAWLVAGFICISELQQQCVFSQASVPSLSVCLNRKQLMYRITDRWYYPTKLGLFGAGGYHKHSLANVEVGCPAAYDALLLLLLLLPPAALLSSGFQNSAVALFQQLQQQHHVSGATQWMGDC